MFLLSIGSYAASGILSIIIGWIPVIGTIVVSAVPTASAFIMIVFLISLYREHAGKCTV